MTPPINIDGTNENYSNVTIDGQDVEQITIDGQDVLSVIPDSGVSRWTFDDADTSGSTAVDVWDNNDGTINGATGGVGGQYNDAYDFDGTDDYVDIAGCIPSDMVFSISFWINGDNIGSAQEGLFFVGDTASCGVYQATVTTNSTISWSVSCESSVTSTTSLSSGTWYMITLTMDNGTAEVYINETREDGPTDIDGGRASPSDINEVLGVRYSGGSLAGHFDGVIDDPRVYNKVLSDSEVSDLYNTGSI